MTREKAREIERQGAESEREIKGQREREGQRERGGREREK